MEKYVVNEEVIVFGKQVKSFPKGVKDVFDELVKLLGYERAYYGISWFDKDGNIIYYATAQEQFKDEAKQYNYETLTIEKGEYISETIYNWMSKTDCIKDVFGELMKNEKADKTKPCVEWYKSNDEMLCMIKTI